MYPNEQITGAVVDTAYRLHTQLGPGLLESAYEILLARMLEERGFTVERQKPVTFEFDGIKVKNGFRADLLVENQVIVEVKAVEKLAPVHVRQVLTYLKLLNLPVGLLINFGEVKLKNGLRRVLNAQPVEASAAPEASDDGEVSPG
ncbi:MAG TPA: GxxExxY protein [Longimicrobium sp.]|nr:GxxExxY protein [Longimicrobium sp.]